MVQTAQILNVIWQNSKLNAESYKELLRKSDFEGSILIQLDTCQMHSETEIASFGVFPLVRVSFRVD